MTEKEWHAAIDPLPLATYLAYKVSDRKMRLFFCACSRRIWHLIAQEGYRKIVEVSEIVADAGDIEDDLLRAAEDAAYMQHGGQNGEAALWAATHCGISKEMLHDCLSCDYGDISFLHASAAAAGASDSPEETRSEEKRSQCTLLCCIFGNPFRPVTLSPSWLTSTVLSLAQGIYDERAFDRMPILADALEDAGCDSEEILSHCRGPGPHVRGCFVVDLLLSKE